jgi:hypothetical protein
MVEEAGCSRMKPEMKQRELNCGIDYSRTGLRQEVHRETRTELEGLGIAGPLAGKERGFCGR